MAQIISKPLQNWQQMKQKVIWQNMQFKEMVLGYIGLQKALIINAIPKIFRY